MLSIPKNCIFLEGVASSGKEARQGDIRNGDYRHICPTLYPGSLNVLIEPTHLADRVPATPHQIIDHEHWDHPVSWWRGHTIDADGNIIPCVVTYNVERPFSSTAELLAEEHLRTALHVTDGSVVRFGLWPWWARAE